MTVDDFKQINFSKSLMIDGLVFIWVEKEIIFDIIKIFEKQDMIYVENVCWVMLDETKKKGMLYLLLTFQIEVEDTQKIDVSPAFIRDDYQYVRKSKKTLLIFRR